MDYLVQNSQAMLWLSLAGAVLLLAIMTAWAIYYVVRMLKNANSIIERVTDTLEKVDDILSIIKDKMNSTGAYVAVFAQAVKKIVEYAQSKERSSSKSTRSKK